MALLDDVLDGTGRTPREFGAVQVFAERVVREASGRAQAVIWLQAAFSPCRGAVLLGGQAFSFPELSEGQVVRGVVPLELPPGASAVEVAADAPVTDSSVRVRTPWKLLDTFAVRHEHRPGTSIGPGAALALNMVTLPLGVVVIPGRVTQGGIETSVRVEKARELGALRCQVIDEDKLPSEASSAAWETVWVPGRPLPARHEGALMGSAVPLEVAAPQDAAAPVSTQASPWAAAQAMVARGHSRAEIERQLRAEHGLTPDDMKLLLQDLPDDRRRVSATAAASDGGLNKGALLGVGLVVFGELFLTVDHPVFVLLGIVPATVGVAIIALTFGAWRERPLVEASSVEPLEDPAPVERCGRHPHLASLGACPRCGTWSCRACAPDPKFPALPCLACERSRPFRLERSERTARSTSRWVAGVTTLLFSVGVLLPFRPPFLTLWAPVFVALLIFALIQGFTRRVWSALLFIVAAVATSVVLAILLAAAGLGFLVMAFIPLATAVIGAVVTFASTQLGHQRAVALAA